MNETPAFTFDTLFQQAPLSFQWPGLLWLLLTGKVLRLGDARLLRALTDVAVERLEPRHRLLGVLRLDERHVPVAGQE